MRFSAMRVWVAAGAALAVSAGPLSAQVPAGGEFIVNSTTLGNQRDPCVAADPTAGFLIVWDSDNDQDGSGLGVFAQAFDAAGQRRGGEFQVNVTTTNEQFYPAVAAEGRGRFLVVWMGRQSNGQMGIFGRRVGESGQPMGPEFAVSTVTTTDHRWPAVASNGRGTQVVLWESGDGVGSPSVFARRYVYGTALGAPFMVNTYTTGDQRYPSAAIDASGAFVVVWDSEQQDGDGLGVFGQRYAADGSPLGSEFRVAVTTTGLQAWPDVDASSSGGFVVTWAGAEAFDVDVYARRFDPSGLPVGGEFRLNGYTTSGQTAPSIAIDDAGSFIASWESWGQDGQQEGVVVRRFTATGVARGPDFVVNTYTAASQRPAPNCGISSDAAGNAVVVWSSFQDGSGAATIARRFGGLSAAALRVDTTGGGGGDGNAVFEPGEAVDVRPSWRNATGAAQAVTAVASGLAGPAGATYTMLDPSGAYGTVPDGAVRECTDCYRVSVSVPPARPALDWDVSLLESILPDAQGQQKRWRLHIGDSFPDVPRASGFYRFIETLLHRSVTAGCTTAEYCPAASTTREQMAVFVLLSREGSGYLPPACATPAFPDVPAASPFCRFVEELARRGVVAGCGGGNYCPQAAVTREAMAVFVLRTLDPTLQPPACTTPVFADVPASSSFCRWIEELARRGIVTGCGGGNYCPTAPVTREQMAVFLTVTFGLSLYGP